MRNLPPQKQANKTLTVATFNVNFGLGGEPKTLHAMIKTEADILLLQETTSAWERAVRNSKRLTERFAHIHFFHNRSWPAGGLAFLSRFPLRAFKNSPSAIGFFNAIRVVADTPLGTMQLINVHLKPMVSNWGSYVSGYFFTGPERKQEMQGHKKILLPKIPALFIGDFNEEKGGGLGLLTKGGRFVDALQQFSPRSKTWRWPWGPFVLRQQLDHIVYDKTSLRCTGAWVLDRGRSDHLPVVARFQTR